MLADELTILSPKYIPLDGAIVTQSALEYILDDSECSVVLALRKFVSRVPVVDAGFRTCLCLEDAIEANEGLTTSKPIDFARSNDGIYVIYTSGMSFIRSLIRLHDPNSYFSAQVQLGNQKAWILRIQMW